MAGKIPVLSSILSALYHNLALKLSRYPYLCHLVEKSSIMVYPIVAYGANILRQVAEPIGADYPDLEKLIADMWDTMYASDGIGLAAPQIGVSRKIVVIDHDGDKYTLINPEILSKEGNITREEGCLSFPGIYANVDSPEKMTVRYMDEDGTSVTKELEGFAACVFSHEIDHLHGRLLIDRVSPLKRQFMKKRIAKKAAEDKQ